MSKHFLLHISIVFITLWLSKLHAQDTLPAFSVVYQNGRVIISWVNQFQEVKQISIQRSPDSLKGFKTILTVPDPKSVTNGFLDQGATSPNEFYKLYILLDDGNYMFSKPMRAKKALPGQGKQNVAGVSTDAKNKSDGLSAGNIVAVKPEVAKPSVYVFTGSDGNLTIILPKGNLKNYSIKFLDKGREVITLYDLEDNILTLDKASFLKAGTYDFELYEGDKLKEKNQIVVPKNTLFRQH